MMAGSFANWQQVYLRILLAGLMAAVVFRKSFSLDFLRRIEGRDWVVYIVRALLAYVVGVGFFTIAIQNAPLSTVSFISSLPLMGVLGWVLFRQKMRWATLPFIGLSIVGLALLTGLSLKNLHLGWGETAALISLLGFDVGFLMSRYHPKGFSNFQNTTLLLLVAWIPLFLISVGLHEPLIPPHVTAAGWIGLVVSSVLNVAGLYMINYIFGHLKAYVAGNLLLLEGVFALFIGLILYGETPASGALAGAVIILGCAFAISLIDGRGEKPVTT